jgi:hypothetical protein
MSQNKQRNQQKTKRKLSRISFKDHHMKTTIKIIENRITLPNISFKYKYRVKSTSNLLMNNTYHYVQYCNHSTIWIILQ